jgi:hypothetical protein
MSTPSINLFPPPCSFLTQRVAAAMSGDPAIAIQATNASEATSAFVACIFADKRNEANSVEVQIKRSSDGVGPSTIAQAVTYFSRGEPIAPFRPFPVAGVGDSALGEATPGVTFIVFSCGDLLVYVGARSVDVNGAALRNGVERLAELVAAGLWAAPAWSRANRSTAAKAASIPIRSIDAPAPKRAS